MDEQSQLESLENNFDLDSFENLVEDMIPDEWENVRSDVINNFDSNLPYDEKQQQ